MSVLYDEVQEAMAREAGRVLTSRHDKDRLLGLLETTGAFDETFWQTAIEQGWSAILVPEEFGGLGLGLLEAGIVAQAAGAVTAGAPFLTGNSGAVSLLLAGQDAGARDAWLPKIAGGEAIGTVAFAEAEDALPARPSVVLDGGALTGAKSGVPGAIAADFAVVLASRGAEPVLALVKLDEGMRRPIDSFDNSRLYADLVFDKAPATLLLAGEAARNAAVMAMARMAIVAAHEQTGGAEAVMMIARDYALERKAFGQPIAAFQSIKHRIAELYGLVEVARANCIHAASREYEGDFVLAAASARLSACEAYDTAARDAVQIHGGIGVTWQLGLHLHMRRTRSLSIEHGNALFWEDLLVSELERAAA